MRRRYYIRLIALLGVLVYGGCAFFLLSERQRSKSTSSVVVVDAGAALELQSGSKQPSAEQRMLTLQRSLQPFAEPSQQAVQPTAEPSTGSGRTPRTIIHFVFGMWSSNEPMPAAFASNLALWRRANTEHEVWLWNRTAVVALVRSAYSEYEETFMAATKIQQADLSRYMIVHHYGGFYADLDVVCANSNHLGSLIPHMPSPEIEAIVYWERGRLSDDEVRASTARAIRNGVGEYRTRLANYAFWSRAHARLLDRTIALATRRVARTAHLLRAGDSLSASDKEYLVLYTTGPDVFTEAVLGVRDLDYVADASDRSRKVVDEDEVLARGSTADGILVIDPGPRLMNRNTFSWKGRDNDALKR